jgi:hypothetical protein
MYRTLGTRHKFRSEEKAINAAKEAGQHGYIREFTKDGIFRTKWIPIRLQNNIS